MGSLLVQLLLLFQPDSLQMNELINAVSKNPAVVEQRLQSDTELRHRLEFKNKWETLVEAVEGFAAEYNDGKGQVWPEKKAAALREAMKALEQSEPRLRKDIAR